jgi:hypothetical protein
MAASESVLKEAAMRCASCCSEKQGEFSAEMIIHFRGLKHLDNPGVWLFPKLLVCLDCGVSQFIVPGAELASLAKVILPNRSASLEKSDGDSVLGSEIAC